jgi:hypothetical protein
MAMRLTVKTESCKTLELENAISIITTAYFKGISSAWLIAIATICYAIGTISVISTIAKGS